MWKYGVKIIIDEKRVYIYIWQHKPMNIVRILENLILMEIVCGEYNASCAMINAWNQSFSYHVLHIIYNLKIFFITR